MSEILKLEYRAMSMMSEDALEIFASEIGSGNTVSISRSNGRSVEFSTLPAWDSFLLQEGFRKPPVKKNYRI